MNNPCRHGDFDSNVVYLSFWSMGYLLCTSAMSSCFIPKRYPKIMTLSHQKKTRDKVQTTQLKEPKPLDAKAKTYETEPVSLEFFRNNQWKSLKRNLCGDGFPNADGTKFLQREIFRLGRQEIFPKDDPTIANLDLLDHSKYRKMVNDFFNRGWGATEYYGSKSFQTVYMRIFKGGNDQIRSMEKELYSKKTLFSEAYLKNNYHYELLLKVAELGDMNTCFYIAIRDPVSHFLSGYNKIETRKLTECANPTLEHCVRWKKEFAPYHYAVPYVVGDRSAHEKLLKEFVKDVLRAKTLHWQHTHVYSMSGVLSCLNRYRRKLNRYLPTLVNLTFTWPAFLSETCPYAPPLSEMPEQMKKIGDHHLRKIRLGPILLPKRCGRREARTPGLCSSCTPWTMPAGKNFRPFRSFA